MKPSLMLNFVVYIVTAGVKIIKNNCVLVANILHRRTVTRRRGKTQGYE